MTTTELLDELTRRGITLVAIGNHLKFHPREAMTTELVEQLKKHKAEVLAIMADATEDTIFVSHVKYSGDMANEDDLPCAAGDSDVALDDIDLWPGDNAVDLPPCELCGGLELWQSLTGNWRCLKCDPPTKAQRMLEKAEQLRKRYGLSGQRKNLRK